MTASDLRELAAALNWHTSQTFTPSHKEAFTKAAEVLELIAWAEESGLNVERGDRYWWTRLNDEHSLAEETLIGLLRRAKEASKL